MQLRLFLFFIFIMCFHVANSYAYDTVKIITINDGDTVTLEFLTGDRKGNKEKIRFYGIDAPELSQPYGQASKRHLNKLLNSRDIQFKYVSKDQYQRLVGILFVDGKDINIQMVDAGYAWIFNRFSKNKKLNDALRDAERKRRGLWNDKNTPIPPWIYRQLKSKNNGLKHPPIYSPYPNLIICINMQTNALTYQTSGICPKGNKAIVR